MNNAKDQQEGHDHSVWPRDYNFRSAVAEQQEIITQQAANPKLKQPNHEKINSSANDL